jgi:cytochrome oxidase Cu insertion factor (SCO1/SenC/PrrC family)
MRRRMANSYTLPSFALFLALAACSGSAPLVESELDYEGSALSGAAQDFTLLDQNNQQVSLSDFRGKVVVLAFMDSQCKEVCPLTSAHLRMASEALGEENQNVTFMAVNVNAAANTVEEVANPTRQWRLDEIPGWHFLTGSAAELEAVWAAYGIGVVLPVEEGEELVHTPGVFLIDQTGQKRWYISTPFDEAGVAQWTPPLNELLLQHIYELLGEA